MRVGRAMRGEEAALRREHAQRDEAGHAHARERDAPVERRRQRVAHDRRQRVAQVAADAVRRVRVPEAPRRDVGVEDREVARVEDAVADAHQGHDRKQPVRAGRQPDDRRAAGEQPQTAQQHRTRAETVDREACDELGDAARGIEHADQRAEQRPRHVELGAQQREQRRQRELEEMREGVGDADEADHADVAAERVGGDDIQAGRMTGDATGVVSGQRERRHYIAPAAAAISLERRGTSMVDKVTKSDAEWKAQLTPEQFRVTRKKGTERAFSRRILGQPRAGMYRCVCCGTPLFDAGGEVRVRHRVAVVLRNRWRRRTCARSGQLAAGCVAPRSSARRATRISAMSFRTGPSRRACAIA